MTHLFIERERRNRIVNHDADIIGKPQRQYNHFESRFSAAVDKRIKDETGDWYHTYVHTENDRREMLLQQFGGILQCFVSANFVTIFSTSYLLSSAKPSSKFVQIIAASIVDHVVAEFR